MNTNRPTNTIINAEYFRNRFAKHDVAIKELIKELTNEIEEVDPKVKKIYSRKKRNYQEAFVKPDLQKK